MSQVYWYNLTTHEIEPLTNIDSVDSIAVDWLGKKLYWSNRKQQVVSALKWVSLQSCYFYHTLDYQR